MIVAGWEQMITAVDLHGLPKQHLLAIVDEAERWVRTIAALLAEGRRGPQVAPIA